MNVIETSIKDLIILEPKIWKDDRGYFFESYNRNTFKALGIDEVYCISCNDAFVMNAWAKEQRAADIKFIPDGSCEFTAGMDMNVAKDNLGFGARSWRYAMVVNDGVIEKMFVEPGKSDDCETDPYGEQVQKLYVNI